MTFEDLRRENAARCEESFYPIESRTPIEWAAAIAEETGEVARIAKRIRDGIVSEQDARGDMGDELADIITYVDLLAARMGIDLASAVAIKFNHVSHRVHSERRLYVEE